MKKYFLIIIVLVIFVLIFIKKGKEDALLNEFQGKMVYFYSTTCPHCAKVEKFFKENSLENKIQLEKREIHQRRENLKLLILVAKRKCNLKENEIGVPLFWDGKNEKCLWGDQAIINYFKENILTKYE